MAISHWKDMKMEFKQWLEMKYLNWQHDNGSRKTVLEFAEYLGSTQQTVSGWMNGTRKPQGENIELLAHKLGIEVYDVLGLPRPDRDLFYLQSIWDSLSTEERRRIREQAEKYEAENTPRKSPRPRRAG
jgi:transcriptional regulator with XRE-family HTH domain